MTPSTTPALYLTRIRHARAEPVRHGFDYRGYSWFFDIDAAPQLPWWLRPLGAVRARDHLDGPGATLRERVADLLTAHHLDAPAGPITALMSARVLGYVFDPLTVFWCHDADGRLDCVVAEVHNTYGQRHAYVVHPDRYGYAEVTKQFYVSPFNAVDGRYHLRMPEPDGTLAIEIALRRPGRAPFHASMTGHRVPLTSHTLLRAQLRAPFASWLTAARIRRQGIALWARGVPVIPRPRAESADHTARTTS
ncbi:DUF1365 domain-containing protein [Nocardia cyriacigeorgica]|uniref:DUF1365 domain-containing protein n=1 Tax=Nocardia cyriacigeorgica TaxID=135487 RepID=UPI001895A3F6|nr:DUF1365 domain-containing protein [Nocardia cyriacigeorgica]MBF6090584.1 DUF1365 domain-containing protein [Nocardia cyriacigeorgica]MBF6095627.1 DUF1365 domain-containing protein [Nocardia cyriacigeorgica]MBF6399647.1 DUF1365 domain-containing protein [Nocardia cyriacigeorgica]MBF6405277.1 DUF1365 domain-containing protein [Nocardia cyriacigeorgica]